MSDLAALGLPAPDSTWRYRSSPCVVRFLSVESRPDGTLWVNCESVRGTGHYRYTLAHWRENFHPEPRQAPPADPDPLPLPQPALCPVTPDALTSYLLALAESDREAFLSDLFARFCPHCYRHTPHGSQCQCWNDE